MPPIAPILQGLNRATEVKRLLLSKRSPLGPRLPPPITGMSKGVGVVREGSALRKLGVPRGAARSTPSKPFLPQPEAIEETNRLLAPRSTTSQSAKARGLASGSFDNQADDIVYLVGDDGKEAANELLGQFTVMETTIPKGFPSDVKPPLYRGGTPPDIKEAGYGAGNQTRRIDNEVPQESLDTKPDDQLPLPALVREG